MFIAAVITLEMLPCHQQVLWQNKHVILVFQSEKSGLYFSTGPSAGCSAPEVQQSSCP